MENNFKTYSANDYVINMGKSNQDVPVILMYQIDLNGRYFGIISELDMFVLKQKVQTLHPNSFCLATYTNNNGKFGFSGYSILNSSLNVIMEAKCLNG